jgi:hypothetical protein
MKAIRNGYGAYTLEKDADSACHEPPADASKWLVCGVCGSHFWVHESQRTGMPSGCPGCNAGAYWKGIDWWVLSSYDWPDQEAGKRYRERAREARELPRGEPWGAGFLSAPHKSRLVGIELEDESDD